MIQASLTQGEPISYHPSAGFSRDLPHTPGPDFGAQVFLCLLNADEGDPYLESERGNGFKETDVPLHFLVTITAMNDRAIRPAAMKAVFLDSFLNVWYIHKYTLF